MPNPEMKTLTVGNNTFDIRDDRIGNLADLDTTDKSSVVSAINEAAQAGSGLTPEIKNALLQIAEKVAYIDDQGQQYYNDLMAALYPVDSISAVFTQGSAVIYDTDSLDTLKQYLVVTANYSGGTSATVTDYTLSGTLAAGTSTITVSYSGKTTTFNVTVTGIVCPLLNGTYYDSGNEYKVTVSNGHHLKCEVIGNSGSSTHFIMLNAITGEISVSTSSSINNKGTVFSIPSGKTVTIKMTNIVIDKNGGTPSFQFLSLARLANSNTSFIATAEAEHPAGIDVTATKATTAETNIGAIGVGVNGRKYSIGAYLEFDLELYDDDNVYVGGR